MTKRIIQDIVFNKQKVDKVLQDNNFPIEREVCAQVCVKESYVDLYQKSKPPKKKTSSWKYIIILILFLLFIGGIYFSSSFFERADVRITQKHQIFNLENRQFNALKTDKSSKTANSINFEITINSSKEYTPIILTKSEEVSLKAKGSVTIYNENSTKGQNLSAGMFLADNSGKAYKIDKAVYVPGYKLVKNKIVPGSASVGITAFLPGDVYNGSPKSFTITSFKNTPKYQKIYGRILTPLTGGAKGLVYTIEDKDKVKLDEYASTIFKKNLFEKMSASVPDGWISYPGAQNFSYQMKEDILSSTPSTKIEISGTVSAVILKEKDLSRAVLKSLLPNVSDRELREIQIPGLNNLTFNFTEKDQLINKNTQSISFVLSGKLDSIWYPDTNSIKNDLLQISKNDLPLVFKQYSGIENANVKLFPPWSMFVPNDISKVNITIK